MVNRRNSFQLYGADFVIMDDFSVWLIEINTNPRLYPPSSVVTNKLYPEVIEDIIKGEFQLPSVYISLFTMFDRVKFLLLFPTLQLWSTDVKINEHQLASLRAYLGRRIRCAEQTFMAKEHLLEFEDIPCFSQIKLLETCV